VARSGNRSAAGNYQPLIFAFTAAFTVGRTAAFTFTIAFTLGWTAAFTAGRAAGRVEGVNPEVWGVARMALFTADRWLIKDFF
jgi:hypothetical protein